MAHLLDKYNCGDTLMAPEIKALLCFDVELAPGAQHPVWARIMVLRALLGSSASHAVRKRGEP